MDKNFLFLLPRDRNTGLNNVMQILARRLNAQVEFVDPGDGYHFGQFLRLMRTLRQAKREGLRVHSSGLVPDMLNRLSGKKGSSTTVHNFLAPDYTAQYGLIKGMLATTLHVRALRSIEQVLGCSAAVTKNLHERYNIRSSSCLNGCSDCSAPNPTFDGHRCYYFAGPLIWRKRVDLAAAAICDLDPLGQLRVFGDGPERDQVKAAMSARPQDLTINSVECPPAHYSEGQFYISFASFEGMPLGVLEAVKRGLIPVLSDIPSHAEALQELEIPELQTFKTPTDGILWAMGLTKDDRLSLSQKIREHSFSVFSEIAFVKRFTKCLLEK